MTTKESLSEEQHFWDRESLDWKNHYGLFGDAKQFILNSITDEVKPKLLRIPRKAKIINLGAGANNISYFDVQKVIARTIALDFSPKMLKLNEALMKVMADINISIPLASESTDFCFSSFLMRYLTEDTQRLMFEEIWRVLKRKKQFVIADFQCNQFPYQKTEFDIDAIKAMAKEIGFLNIDSKLIIKNYCEKMCGYATQRYIINLGIISGMKP